jgi:holliday junction DNA helicase RuvA
LIRRIKGELTELYEESAMIAVGGITYEVLVSPHVRDRLRERDLGCEVELHTYHYLQTDPQKSVPVLLGFETETQREFFERLIEVPKFGPRSAVRAFALPVATLAKAIEIQDAKLLRSLPGVGPQRAKDIIATLSGKVGRFLGAEDAVAVGPMPAGMPATDFEQDALSVLTGMGIAYADALRSVQQARAADPDINTADALVKRVFKH